MTHFSTQKSGVVRLVRNTGQKSIPDWSEMTGQKYTPFKGGVYYFCPGHTPHPLKKLVSLFLTS